MKVAVVGSGAAAVGALRALAEWAPKAEVTLLDWPDERTVRDAPTLVPPEAWSRDELQQFYSHLRQEYGFKFPPPKTHFGISPRSQDVAGWGPIWIGQGRGGLTRYWGGSVLPFTERELNRWPISTADLHPYYRRIADLIGIAGRRDALNRYFTDDFVNRPPIRVPAVVEALERVLAAANNDHDFDLFAGVSWLAVETRDTQAARCVYCGQCMTGCFTDAIYSSLRDLDRFTAQGLIRQTIAGKVRAFEPRTRKLVIATSGGQDTLGPFDRIYLCAGCLGSIEIGMRSVGRRDGPVMTDNAIYTFPIFYFGSADWATDPDRYFALTNLLIACVPANANDHTAMIQIYPSFDYLWRYFLPVSLWRSCQPLGRVLRRRVLIARLYVHSTQSQHYALSLDAADRLHLRLARPPTPLRALERLWPELRRALSRGRFNVPRLRPVRARTSSHYAGGLPLGGDLVANTGAIAPGIFVCDSAAFPDGPAISPTLTIMANACRTVHQSL